MTMKKMVPTPTIVASVALLILNCFPALSSGRGPPHNGLIRVMRMRQLQKELNDEHENIIVMPLIESEEIIQNNHRSSSAEPHSRSRCRNWNARKLVQQKPRSISLILSNKETNCEVKQQDPRKCNDNSLRSRKMGEHSQSIMVKQCSSNSSGNFHGNNGNNGDTNLRDSYASLNSPPKNRYINDNGANDQSDSRRTFPPTPLKKMFSAQSGVSPIKLKVPQPRKKELWLPWPLGAIRNDFYSFAASEEQRRHHQRQGQSLTREMGGERIGQYQQQTRQPWQIKQESIIHRSRDWASKMLHRGNGSIRRMNFPALLFHGSRNDRFVSSEINNIEDGSNPRYWSKDPTTSLATASATMGKVKSGNLFAKQMKNLGMNRQKQQQKHYEGTIRGGENNSADPSENGKIFDKDVVLRYLKLQASVRLRQLGYVGSDLSIHLPPAAPVLLFYYMLPSKQDPIRRLVKYSLTGATLSWMHSEATKYRRFSPLPVMMGVNVRRPNLPPFLPEEWVDVDRDVVSDGGGDSVASALNFKTGRRINSDATHSIRGNTLAMKYATDLLEKSDRGDGDDTLQHTSHHLWDPFQSFGTISSAYRSWLEGHDIRNKQLHIQRRIQVRDQLLRLKKTSSMSASNSTSTSSSTANTSDAGYALVTGASSGIGRALAVELARYRIPLILVARDLSRLRSVAEDIETHYDVPCRILRADLSSPDTASRIHAATTSAGLNVDILVNNAGVCTHGDFVDGDEDDMSQMMLVNIGAVTQLSRLYGEDMKERRRGRILFVSSMCGVLPGNPGVAVYAASTAYKKSLAMSLGREMERFGVGVTCLLPGAVKDTSFASRSGVEQAACFHFPGYAKSAEVIAGEGIKGLMLGYPEIYPGWHNRAFAKAVLPMLPPRFSIMIGEWAWNPWQWGDVMPLRRVRVERPDEPDEMTSPVLNFAPNTSWKFLRSSPLSNQIQLPDSARPKSGHATAVSPQPAIEIVAPKGDVASLSTVTNLEDVNHAIQAHDSVLEETSNDNAVRGSDDSQMSKEKGPNMDENKSNLIEEKRNVEVVVDVPALLSIELPQKVPVTYPSISPSSPPDAVGYFEPSRKQISSPDEKPQGRDGTANSQKLSDSNGQTWYPSMMDKKEYDFFDRRLNFNR